MKPRDTREKHLGMALAFALAFLLIPGLFGDDHKPTTNSGHSAQPARSTPTPTHSAPSGGGSHSNAAPAHNNPPASRTPSSGSAPGGTHTNTPTYNPGGRTNTGNQGGNPGARTNTGNPTYNPGGRGNTGNQGNNPGAHTNTPTYNPGNRTNTGNQGNNPGNRTNTPTYNPGNRNNPGNQGNNPGNRGNTGNPGNTYGNRGNAGNPGNTYGNRNPGNNPGGRTFHPPQGAQVSRGPGGNQTYTHGNAQYHTNSNGQLTHYSRPGTEARFHNDGHISSAHFTRPDHSNVYVNRGPRGERTVVTVRSDHSRVVSYGPRRGYVERPFSGRPGYISRTYVVGGRPYARVYRSYSYRGYSYYRYVPPVYYSPVFYGWAYNPWVRPVSYRWSWFGTPWFGFYGSYFTPAPVYPTASLWLTDYIIAENLRLAYESQAAANAQAQQQQYQQQPQGYPQNSQVTMTPEIKAAIAEEVRQQLEAERAAAAQPNGQQGNYGQPSNSPGYNQGQPGYSQTSQTGGDVAPPALDPKQRIFVVSSSLDVAAAGGQGCSLTPGDIILRTGDEVGSGGTIAVSVLSSKPGDCPVNSAAGVDVAALQEMHNQFREQIDTGLQTLAQGQGQNGLPAAPPPGARQVAEGQAPVDSASNVESALMQQQSDVSQSEAEIQQATAGSGQ